MELNIDTYKRPAALSYTTPSARRFFTVKTKRLIRLARRIHDGRLFLPEIVTALREAADELIQLGNIILLTDRAAELLSGLRWIKSTDFAPEDLEWDVREKTRRHVQLQDRVRCSLCRTRLVWPAQIVWRRGLQVVQTSADIGIHCLTRDAIRNGWGKLQDLITQVRAVRAQQSPPSEVAPAEAPPMPLPDSLASPVLSSAPSREPFCPALMSPRLPAACSTMGCRQLSLSFPQPG
jgi:hypothetical protein